MQLVAERGTAAGIFLYQDQVAAKTGTAQTGDLAQNTDDWMIAFAPASDPVVAAAVVVPYQAISAYGATVAGPVMKCVIEARDRRAPAAREHRDDVPVVTAPARVVPAGVRRRLGC